MVNKVSLRADIRKQLLSLEQPTYEHLSQKIANRLFETKEWKQAKTIGITISLFPEVDTWHIIRKAWQQEKQVAAPQTVRPFYNITFFSKMLVQLCK